MATIADILRGHAAERPDRPALTDGSLTVTFAELDDRSSRVAQALASAGVGPGDRVAILARNSLPWYEVFLGAAKLGAVTVGINVRLAAPEVSSVLADARPAAVLVDADLQPLMGGREPTVTLGPPGSDARKAYEAWVAAFSADDPHGVAPDDVVLQLYSSGTTGEPKGAMLTNANLEWTPRMGREQFEMGASSVNLLTAPMFHVGGVGYSLTGFGNGAHTVVLPSADPVAMLAAIADHGVTHVFMVPTVLRSLLQAQKASPVDLSSLHLIAYGAAPIDDRTLLEALDVLRCRFLGVYGMTEAAGSVTALLPEDHDPGGPRSALLRSVGRPLPWHEVVVTDPATGRPSATGEIGELWVRSPQVMAAYWGRPDLDAVTKTPDGWLRTGDAGWCDADGYLFLHDRIKDMLISGGENVYPAEVERVLQAHPAVREVAVIGVPHDRWGETVKAVVVLDPAGGRPPEEATGAELIAFCRDRLAHFKCPTSVEFIDALPTNASGKIVKSALRQRFAPPGPVGVGLPGSGSGSSR